jgi:hypothetical protein
MARRLRDYAAEYAARIGRGIFNALSRRAAAGHPEPGEPTARDIQETRRHPDTAPIDMVRRAAWANARAQLGEFPGFNPERLADRIRQIEDRQTLVTMANATADEWSEWAALQIPGNPFFYH